MKLNHPSPAIPFDPKKLPQMRSLRLSSNEAQHMSAAKIKSILENNKYFPHLYDPYYDRKDIKKNLHKVISMEKKKEMEELNRRRAEGSKLTSN